MTTDFKAPSIEGRKFIRRSDLKPGDVVGFLCGHLWKEGFRTGFICIHPTVTYEFVYAINLWKDDGDYWSNDYIPEDDIVFFEVTELEKAKVYMNALLKSMGWYVGKEKSMIMDVYTSKLSKIIKDINFEEQEND